MNLFAARQPIFDKSRNLFAYELLFRDGVSNVFPNIDGDKATSKLLAASQFSHSLSDFTGSVPGLINFTLDTLLKKYPTLVAPSEIIIEILETVKPGKRLLQEVKELKGKGYRIALDDYIHDPVWRHFYPYVDIIKVDVYETDLDTIHTIKNAVAKFPNIKLLAEKVETYEEFQQYMDLGFSYFQGYFFAKPELVSAKSMAPSEMALAELLFETSKLELDIKKIAQVFERDISLSYKILRYSYSVTNEEFSNIKQALVAIGTIEIKKFISLIFTAQVASSKPSELLKVALTRGRILELLAEQQGKTNILSSSFLTGLMSLVGAILDDDIENVLQKLPLSQDIKNALIFEQGILAEYLAMAVHIERAEWAELKQITDGYGIELSDVSAVYNDAILWVDNQMLLLGSEAS